MMNRRFRNRREAGRWLGRALARYAGQPGTLVLALPRGGVPVGYEVARALGAPLDVYVVRKLGAPGRPELALGALAPGGLIVLNEAVMAEFELSESQIARAASVEEAELERRARFLRGERPAPVLEGRTVLLVDDGIATGSTMWAAVTSIRAQKPQRLVVAVPVAPPAACEALRSRVDELVCLLEPSHFRSVGEWYLDFTQTSDEEVATLLARAARPPQAT